MPLIASAAESWILSRPEEVWFRELFLLLLFFKYNFCIHHPRKLSIKFQTRFLFVKTTVSARSRRSLSAIGAAESRCDAETLRLRPPAGLLAPNAARARKIARRAKEAAEAAEALIHAVPSVGQPLRHWVPPTAWTTEIANRLDTASWTAAITNIGHCLGSCFNNTVRTSADRGAAACQWHGSGSGCGRTYEHDRADGVAHRRNEGGGRLRTHGGCRL